MVQRVQPRFLAEIVHQDVAVRAASGEPRQTTSHRENVRVGRVDGLACIELVVGPIVGIHNDTTVGESDNQSFAVVSPGQSVDARRLGECLVDGVSAPRRLQKVYVIAGALSGHPWACGTKLTLVNRNIRKIHIDPSAEASPTLREEPYVVLEDVGSESIATRVECADCDRISGATIANSDVLHTR